MLSSALSRINKSSARAAAASVRWNSTRFYSSTMHGNDPGILEREKERNLKGVQHETSTPHEHAPGWNEHLASVSEAFVKADKSLGTISELQSRTVEYLRTRHSKDNEEGGSSTTAFYLRDEVSGPLSGAEGKEDESVDLRHEEEVWVDNTGVRMIKEELMTPSEQDVKADRGEI